MSRRWLFATLVLLGGCCAKQADDHQPNASDPQSGSQTRRAQPPKLGPEYDVYEALVRHYMAGFAADPAKQPSVVFVDLDGDDPPAAFLKRFADAKLAVKPASADKEPRKGLLSIRMSFRQVQWQGTDQARVMGVVFESWVEHTCGTPWPTVVSRKNGKWQVVIQ